MSVWRDRSRRLIAELVAVLPDSATVEERRKALWGKGYHAHLDTSWGRKMWGQEVRKYLARHGDSGATKILDRLNARRGAPSFEFADDISFPFRGQIDA